MLKKNQGPKILLIDCETAPAIVYTWSLFDTVITIDKIIEPGHMLCYSAKWLGEKNTTFDSVKRSGKKKMVGGVLRLLDEADAVVTYNGMKFDIPTLNREILELGMMPPSPYRQVDLYRAVRVNFKFQSNKLDHVCKILGIGSKVQHKGMELWKGCMKGDKKSWREMERYNRHDVFLLERLYEKLLPWIRQHPNYALFSDETRPVCTNCGSADVQRRGLFHTNVLSYPRFRCNACGKWLRGRASEKSPRSELIGVN